MKVSLLFVVIFSFYLLSSVKSEEQEAVSNVVTPATTDTQTEETAKDKRNANDNKEKGACECAVFGTEAPEQDAKPVMSRTLVNVLCDESGQKQCQDLCVVLARAGREKGGQVLCDTVGHADNLRPSVFSRTCNQVSYSFSGLTSNDTYCCHENVQVQCEDAEQ